MKHKEWKKILSTVGEKKDLNSDKVVILAHIITYLLRYIGLRQTVELIKGYLQQIGKI